MGWFSLVSFFGLVEHDEIDELDISKRRLVVSSYYIEWKYTKNCHVLLKIYPRKQLLFALGLSCWHFICSVLLPAESDDPFDDDDDDAFSILILNGGRLLFNSWLYVRSACWLRATSIICCCGVTFGTDWRDTNDVVSIGDDDKRRCNVSGDTWREIFLGDVRLIKLLLLSKDENEIHKSVLGNRRVHL